MVNAEVFIEAIGLAAPGMPSWQQAARVLRGELPYEPVALPLHSPALLPANERRRATPAVRLAFQAAEDAMLASTVPAASLATVFASSDADLNIIHRISSALAATPRLISPTDFHNSVHNAAAGYWSIAVGSRAPSSTISAFDASFAVGLAEACGMVTVDRCDTLLVAFDLPPPEPLYAKRPIEAAVSVAVVLTCERTLNTLASMQWALTQDTESTLKTALLESLRLGNPAARALPLLELLAQNRSDRIVLPQAEKNAGLAVELRML
ncbi:MAG: beta-ketoacyl synthase chain length factor [Candidatus Obscuribacterales bacterium]|nr:beta-ketoacyl synthase chain length factor [Steroidobacteraceae bacterium]